MLYRSQWSALSGFIRGLSKSAELYASFQISIRSDDEGSYATLAEKGRKAIDGLRKFVDDFEKALPPEARTSLKSYLESPEARLFSRGSIGAMFSVRAGLIALTALEAEISFLLSDTQEVERARSETAFVHLQRLIAADPEARTKWKTAYQSGETACERLGSTHLLAHQIFGFKINAEGARTDLIFNEPVNSESIQRTSAALVLTEWKIATAKTAAMIYEEARKQAELYKAGPLAGLELAGYRYLVAVSEKNLPREKVPDDLEKNGVQYRHINIAVDPDVPSKQSKKR